MDLNPMADQLSTDQIAEVQEVFSLFDKDCDGAVVISDLGPVLRSLYYNPSKAEIDSLMQECESDGSGVLEFSQFLTMLPSIKKTGDTEEELDEAFRVFDKEGNGTINGSELRHIMTNMGEKLTEEEADDMLAYADADAQGEINYKDLIRMLLELEY